MEKLKISIITVSYNGANTIRQTIESVVNQSYENVEYLIIDGGSTDGTVEIIREYENGIAYWVSEPDGGIYDAMNKGVAAASGDYVQFLGADDALCMSETIAQVVAEIEAKERPSLMSMPIFVIDEAFAIQKLCAGDRDLHNIEKGFMLPHPGMYVKHALMMKYRFDVTYKIIADFEFLLRYHINKGRIEYGDIPVVYFSNEGTSSRWSEVAEEYQRLMKKYEVVIDESFYKQSFKSRLLKWIKTYLLKIGLWKQIQELRGWKAHSCEWNTCRWCRR